jgi:hypothetical protein
VDPAFDAYTVARAWYSYAQEALPPPGPLPGRSAPIGDRLREHVPAHMSMIIFRSAPPRSQTFIAERLQEEGWYDGEAFVPEDWFKKSEGYKGEPVKVGGKVESWSQLAWTAARDAWRAFGIANHLLVDDRQMARLEADAKGFHKWLAQHEGVNPENLDEENLNKEQKDGLFAVRFLHEHQTALHNSNFDDFLTRAQVEADPKTIQVRKLFYEAEQARLARQARQEALDFYEQPVEALKNRSPLQAWREIMEQNKNFREMVVIQEDSYDTGLKYLRAYRFIHGANLTRDLALGAFLGQAAAPAPLAADWALLGLYSRHQLLPEPSLQGPFDGDFQGRPLIFDEVKQQVLRRRDLIKRLPGEKAPRGGVAPPPSSPPQ